MLFKMDGLEVRFVEGSAIVENKIAMALLRTSKCRQRE